MAQEFVLTKKGKIELEQELEYLISTRRAEISEQIKEARSFGDLSENAEYTEARNEQSRVEGRIQELENILRLATIVDDDEVNLERVGIGTKVRILDIEFNEEENYTVMGPMETNAVQHIISNESPVGKALLGRRIGETVTVETQAGDIAYRVLDINRVS